MAQTFLDVPLAAAGWRPPLRLVAPTTVIITDEKALPAAWKDVVLTMPAHVWEALLERLEKDERRVLEEKVKKCEFKPDKRAVGSELKNGEHNHRRLQILHRKYQSHGGSHSVVRFRFANRKSEAIISIVPPYESDGDNPGKLVPDSRHWRRDKGLRISTATCVQCGYAEFLPAEVVRRPAVDKAG